MAVYNCLTEYFWQSNSVLLPKSFKKRRLLAYERNIFEYIIKAFMRADEETRRKLCLSLDGISVTPDSKSEQRIQLHKTKED